VGLSDLAWAISGGCPFTPSYSPFLLCPWRWGRLAGRACSVRWAGRSPVASRVVAGPPRGEGHVKEGVTGSGETCRLRAVVGGGGKWEVTQRHGGRVGQGSCCQTRVAATTWPGSAEQKFVEKAFTSWLEALQRCILTRYPFYLDGHKMLVTEWPVKPWSQLELSVQSLVTRGRTTNMSVCFVRHTDSCISEGLNIVTAGAFILSGAVLSSHWLQPIKLKSINWISLQKAGTSVA